MNKTHKKYVKLLRSARSNEIAAFFAYAGHADAETRPLVQKLILQMRLQEFDHIEILELMLLDAGSQPNYVADWTFSLIGKAISRMCAIFPMKMVNWVAKLFEKRGASAYKELAQLARELNRPYAEHRLMWMQQQELQHERFLDLLNGAVPESKEVAING